jgi:hypothetical protein
VVDPIRLFVIIARSLPERRSRAAMNQRSVTASVAVAQPTTVNYAMSGMAMLGSDYSLSGTVGQVTIQSGRTSALVRTKAITAHVTEGTKTAIMTLQPGSGYRLGNPKQATVSILDSP